MKPYTIQFQTEDGVATAELSLRDTKMMQGCASLLAEINPNDIGPSAVIYDENQCEILFFHLYQKEADA